RAAADVPLGDKLPGGKVEHGNRALVPIGDVEQLRVAAGIQAVCTGARVDEPEHMPASSIDLPDPVRGHVSAVQHLSVGRQLDVLRHRACARQVQDADNSLPPHVDLHHLRGEFAAGQQETSVRGEVHVIDPAARHAEQTVKLHRMGEEEVEQVLAFGGYDRVKTVGGQD